MRICFATRTPFVSGGETVLLRLAKELVRQGHDVCIVCPAGSQSHTFFADHGLAVEAAELCLTDWRHPLRFTAGVRAMRRILHARRVEIAHANDLSTIQPLGLACRKAGLPAVAHVRQMVKPGGPEWYFKFGADHVMTISDYMKRHLLEVSPAVFEGRTTVSLDGVVVHSSADEAAKRAARRELDLPEDRFVFLFANQFNDIKGLPDLIGAVALLEGNLRERCVVCAVGDDMQTQGVYRQAMMQLARDKGVAGVIRFPGFRRDVPTWLAACDWCVAPSLVEPLGATVMEAMAVGRPVIGTRVGGIPEMIREHRTGLLVDGGRPDQLSEAMAAAMTTPGMTASFGQAGYEVAKQEFSIERHARDVLAMYERVLACRGRPARDDRSMGQTVQERPGSSQPDAGILPARGGEAGLTSHSDQARGTHNAGGTPAPRPDAGETPAARPDAGGTPATRPLLAFSQVYPPYVGGSGLWVHRLVQAWPGPAAALCQEHPQAPAEEYQGKTRVRRVGFDFPSWAPDTWRSLTSYRTAARVLRREIKGFSQQSAVVLCGRGIPEGVIARWVGRAPYVTLAHGEEIVTCLTSRKLKMLLRYSYRGARLVIANSENTRRLAIQAGADPERCVVIPPGVDASRFANPMEGAPSWTIRPGAMVVATVGRLEPRKNQVGVIQAVAKLVASGRDIQYVIAGAGVGRPAVEQAIADNNMQSHVTLLGEVSDDDVRALYHACDVFAMPSIQHGPSIEGFGIVFLEAAAAGKPSVAGTAGGSGEAVVHESTGLVVDGTDIEAVASALARLYDRPELRRTFGRNGQQRATQEFDWAIVLQKAHDAILAAIT